jgi:hypothetical protein
LSPEVPDQNRERPQGGWWSRGWLGPALVTGFAILGSFVIYALAGKEEAERKKAPGLKQYDHTHPEMPKRLHPEYPEHRQSPQLSSWWVGRWLSPIIVAAFTIFWTLLIFALIGNRARTWQYGTVPYVPGQTIFSSNPVSTANPPKQVVLPERAPGGPRANP